MLKKSTPLRVAVTGAAGRITYSLLFRLAHGDAFGPHQPIILQMGELPEAMQALEGVAMELSDCAFPLLHGMTVSSDYAKVFKDCDIAILVGAVPRKPGMERVDLMNVNAKSFITQGKALNDYAARHVQVLVVGNPCNTNCLIAMHNAPNIPKKNFHAMTRLDQNRAQGQLATKAGVFVTHVTNVTIWGNHSATQVPDFVNAKIDGKPAIEVIKDRHWLENEFITKVQQRGTEVLNARGQSSAASAANAIIDSLRSLLIPTPQGSWFSSGIWSEKNPYGIDENLIFSFPCLVKEIGSHEIVADVPWDDFLEKRIRITEKELIEERSIVSNMLK